MKLPYNEVKFYPEVKSQKGLSSLWVLCKRPEQILSKHVPVASTIFPGDFDVFQKQLSCGIL